jgi:Fis family transcriptional regulator, factor for inversion stimulation protein
VSADSSSAIDALDAGARATVSHTAPLRSQVEAALAAYFAALEGARPCDLYDVVMREVERPLLTSVLAYVDGNQSRAAEVLGLSRGTLRKKLKDHGII